MSIIVFSGPTIPPKAVAAVLPGATCCGPASQGDVLTVVDQHVSAICLIDGKFDHEPAVTHKELLWALHNNVLVFGAASMGALRAAELADFGMRGHGVIFQNFADGTYEDDDEVTVAHANEEHDFRAASDAMVNIRATMTHAVECGILAPSTAAELNGHAKGMFYAERTYEAMLAVGRNSGLPRTELQALSSWLSLRQNRIDQKRLDAEGLLELVKHGQFEPQARGIAPLESFPHTSAWDQLVNDTRARTGNGAAHSSASATEERELMLEELQMLGPKAFEAVMFPAMWRALALSLVNGSADVQTRDALVEQMHSRVQQAAFEQVADVLRLCGDLDRVLERARAKRDYLAHRAVRQTTPTEALAWYFQRVGLSTPDDLQEYAVSIGLTSVARLLAMIHREMDYVCRH